MKETNFTITGMSCAGCVAAVEKQLKKTTGVESASVNLLEGSAVVVYDENVISVEQLCNNVKSIGYGMSLEKEPKRCEAQKVTLKNRELKGILIKFIVTVILALIMMVVTMLGKRNGWNNDVVQIIDLLAATVVMFYSAGGYHKRALKQLRHWIFTMDTLISMSVGVAYFFSVIRYVVLREPEKGGLFSNSYFDVVGMVMSFVLLGKYIEEKAKYKTNDALRGLIAIASNSALVMQHGEWIETPIEKIVVGDEICLRNGDRVPVDGVLEDDGVFDESNVTGEPLPVNKKNGDQVYSGTLSVGAVTTFRATKVGEDSLLGRIIESVRQAQSSKAPIQRIADKISGVFVPVILCIALITLLSWGLGGVEQPWLHGVYFAISVLCIACPCALGLATPTAITVSMGKASKEGLLIRDAAALERLAKVTDVIFDKTGTLTKGTPDVIDHFGHMSHEEEALLVRAELQSNHPLSSAIVKQFSMMDSDAAPENLKELSGQGLTFNYKGDTYRVGNKDFAIMERSQTELNSTANTDSRSRIMSPCENYFDPNYDKEAKRQNTEHAQAFALSSNNLEAAISSMQSKYPLSTSVYYTKNNQLIMLLIIEDELRDNAKAALASLRMNTGVTLHLLSGDNNARAKAIAKELDIENAYGGLLPQDKQDYIKNLQKEKKIVAMVGDGINDSPALAVADLSVALNTGSDIVTDVAQITSIGGSPYSLEKAISLSKCTVKIIKQNFFWAFFYNLITVPIAGGVFYPQVFVSPMIAAACMAFSSVCVVMNSLRLHKMIC